MYDLVVYQLKKFSENHRQRQKIIAILLVFSFAVAIGTVWHLHLTGRAVSGEAFCGKEEHVHTDECIRKELICTFDHEHTDECYKITYACGKEEHIHTAECYSDYKADVETAEDWEKTFDNVKLNDSWQQNLLAIARSQLGYQESTQNFVLADDRVTKNGYTRYGDWYGNAYGDWSAMFVSFCLHYADIPETAVPYSSGAYSMSQGFAERNLLKAPTGYMPKPGDIVFFDVERDGRADRLGIVSQINSADGEFAVIEGDYEDAVKENFYQLSAADLFGYGTVSAANSALSVPNLLGDYQTTLVRPMMQALARDENGIRIPAVNRYEQLFADKVSSIRAAEIEIDGVLTPIIEVQIVDEYENFSFEKAILHKHSTAYLAPDSPNDKRNLGVECDCTDTVEPIELNHKTTEDGLRYVVAAFRQSIIDDLEDWCIVSYYKLNDRQNTQCPATFFDYDYSGGRNGGNGFNSLENYHGDKDADHRLAVGLKDGYHSGAVGGNHPWNAIVPVYGADGNPIGKTLDADANNGQGNISAETPILQKLLIGASGTDYSDIKWADALDEPGFFTSTYSVGKTIYSDYDLEFYNIGNTYVLDKVYNHTTGKYSTDGVYNIGNGGKHSEGANFWPLDDQKPAGQMFTNPYANKASHNWYFGMRYDIKFSLTPDYIGNLYFTFAGDDDLWVLMDGAPILDLGGMHSAYPTRYDVNGEKVEKPVGGTKEFKSIESWSNQVDLWDYLDEGDYGEHTITVLFLERGGYDSNCYMEFMLPNVIEVPRIIIPNTELEITKVDKDGKPLSGAEFTLYYDEEGTRPAPIYLNKNLTGIAENGRMTVGTDGRIHIYGISDGDYWLYETKPPTGYEMLGKAVLSFTVEYGIVTDYKSSHVNVSAAVSGALVELRVTNDKAGEAVMNIKAVKKWNDDKSHSSDKAVIHLCRDGEPLSGAVYTVTLNSDNDWMHIWNGLPKSNAETGELYEYSIAEENMDGYLPEYSAQWISNTYEITVTNTPNFSYELPGTGGIGTMLYTVGGLSLMTAPILYGCYLRRRDKKGKQQ